MNDAVEDLILVGAGGTSRDVVWAVEGINAIQPRWRVLGFLDDDPAKQGAVIHGYPVLGPISAAGDYPASRLMVGIASYRNRQARRETVERLACPAERFATIIAATASVSRHAHLGWGTAVLHNSIVAPDARLGNHVMVTQSCMIGHNAVLQDYVTLAAGVKVSGSARIDTGAYLGASSVIRDGKAIGKEALVGIGSVVLRDVPERTTVLGNPAAALGRRRSA
jgi:sugar O-acyltransferase (sialic acid O-acetyltransferase NeuD family)